MSTYEELKGLKIKYLSSDTSGDRIQEGEIFYNSSDFNVKSFAASAAWHSSGGLGTGRYSMAQGTGGTVDAAIAIFGRSTTAKTEEYNGTGWAVGGDGNTARYGGAKFGTQTAAVAAGGKNGGNKDDVEEYDGSSWTEVNDYTGTDRAYLAGFGILTAGVICGGVTASPDTWYSLTEEYDGTNWTNGGALNTATAAHGTTGTLTAGLTFGGYSPSLLAKTEEYNGTAWTESGDMNTARSHLAGSGTQTEALAYGGLTPPSTTATEAYDGSTWATSSATLGTATARHSSAGSAANTGLVFGGNPPGVTTTQEFTLSLTATTAGAWASGGNLNTGRKRGSAGGTQTAALFAGGFTSPPNARKAEVEEYNGSAWSEVTNMPTEIDFAGYGGTQTAQVTFGGNAGPGIRNATLEYDGTNWTATNNMGTARYRVGGAGTQTAALGFGGYLGSPFNPAGGSGTTATEEYDGSSWTAGGAMSSPRNYQRSCSGIQTNAIAMGGGAPYIDDTEKYNGSSWSASEDYIFGNAGYIASNGTSADDLRVFSKGGFSAHSATYNGTSYATAPFLATGRHNGGASGSGPSSTSTYFGGHLPGSPKNSNATEEFTGETTALNLKTITDS